MNKFICINCHWHQRPHLDGLDHWSMWIRINKKSWNGYLEHYVACIQQDLAVFRGLEVREILKYILDRLPGWILWCRLLFFWIVSYIFSLISNFFGCGWIVNIQGSIARYPARPPYCTIRGCESEENFSMQLIPVNNGPLNSKTTKNQNFWRLLQLNVKIKFSQIPNFFKFFVNFCIFLEAIVRKIHWLVCVL